MNNGVTNNNSNAVNTQTQPQNVLTPMAGVKIAPAQEGPVNASNSATASSSNAAIAQGSSTVSQTVPSTGIIYPNFQEKPTSPVVSRLEGGYTPPEAPVITATIPVEETPAPSTVEPPKKKKISLTPFLVLIILILGFYTIYSSRTHSTELQQIKYSCTPITASKEEVKLDLNSTLVQSLYSKVATTIREDYAQPEFNDEMKLYLAYRQIVDKDKYDSNCNLFSVVSMEPYTCEVTTNFVPKAFKEETLVQEIKKLYGENANIPLRNIQLGNTCEVGYQYIPARGEFVQGFCNEQIANSYKVTKTLKEASSTRSTIILTEEVKYHENEKLFLPEYLKSGMYYYTFRLDMNYNYVLVSKTYESKY